MAYTAPLITVDAVTGRMKTKVPAGNYSGANIKLATTGQVITYGNPFSANADYAGLIKLQFGGDSNMYGQGASDPATQSVMAVMRQTLDPTVWDLPGIAGSPWQQGGRTTRDWIQTMHINGYTSYNPPQPNWITHAYVPGRLNIAVIMLTTNDVGKDGPSTPYMDGGTVNGVFYASVRENIARIISELKALGWKVLMIIPPENGHSLSASNTTWQYPKQALLRDWMNLNLISLGADKVLDLYPDPFIGQRRADNASYWKEGLHLNENGLAHLAALIHPLLAEIAAGN